MLPGPGRFVYYYRLIEGSGRDGATGASPEGGLFEGLIPRSRGSPIMRGKIPGGCGSNFSASRGTQRKRSPPTGSQTRPRRDAICSRRYRRCEVISQLGSRLGGRRRVALSTYLERKLRDLEESRGMPRLTTGVPQRRRACDPGTVLRSPGSPLELPANRNRHRGHEVACPARLSSAGR